MKKTIGILAHVDSGKTTFAEQILYRTNSIKNRGRVDHKNTFLDMHNIEKSRGITVFSEGAIFQYKDSTYYLIDTPGHVDFSSEMERAMAVMDVAVVIVSAVDGVQAHTETVWQLLRHYKVPTFIFINKVDMINANVEMVLNDIKTKLTKDICTIDNEFGQKKISEELKEFIAENDEELLEKYLEGFYDYNLWISSMKKAIKENKFFPCLSGSALQDVGIESFLERLDMLTFTEYNDKEEFSGLAYKIRYDEKGNRVTHIKIDGGILNVKDELKYSNGNEIISEKINEIRVYNGSKYKIVDKVAAGELFAVVGLSKVTAGQGLGTKKENINYEIVPTLKSKVIFDSSLNIKEVLSNFKMLEAENPSLNVIWNEQLHEIQVHIMGVIQLEVLQQIVEERFNLKVEFGPCEVLYKETITKAAKGYGHFEPLKHYAEVHLLLEPGERNTGVTFKSECHVDNLPTGYQNLVRYYIQEREHRGILTGSCITDIKATLLIGRSHLKHTSGGDFREATLRALRQGLEKAEPKVLEPYYKFKIEVELEHMGRVISDIQKLYGIFDDPIIRENKVIIRGRGPVATFMNYGMELVSFSKGKGSILFRYDGYDFCHNESEIIVNIGYNKNADIEYTANSIFCSKGQGYVVEADKAEEYMHCLR